MNPNMHLALSQKMNTLCISVAGLHVASFSGVNCQIDLSLSHLIKFIIDCCSVLTTTAANLFVCNNTLQCVVKK